ncbi:hypothetical protein [Mucilaginibacter sp. L196]|uniref:hypothetical protein n=1 Tax=Mucilaginibacter sp. L196 TaxID=1641870 RepID=UPI00131D6ED2|nr:hypothetical protein [Mucilaginibacter sp. L196]
MKGLITLKIILTLLILTTYSYRLSAQNSDGQNDTIKRVIIVVRPGYNDQSSTYTNPSNSSTSNNNSGGNTSNSPASNNQSPSSNSNPATASSYTPLAPTTAERSGTPDYMNPVVKKRVTTQIIPVTPVTVKKPTATTGSEATDTTLSVTNIKIKRDTVFITKIDTVLIATQKHTSNRILFLELGGPGLAISLNYDQRLSEGKEGWGYRVGMGYFGDGGNTVFTIPLQVNYLIGSNGKYFELGGGTTFLNTTGDNTGKTFIFDRITGFIGTATIGVRYEPEKSLNFRLGFVPIFSNDEIIYAGGFSVGYTF